MIDTGQWIALTLPQDICDEVLCCYRFVGLPKYHFMTFHGMCADDYVSYTFNYMFFMDRMNSFHARYFVTQQIKLSFIRQLS